MNRSLTAPARGSLVSSGVPGSLIIPDLVAAAGEQPARRFLEFFAAQIRNQNTRAAYYRAACRFLAWCLDHGCGGLSEIEPLHVAAWLELRLQEASAPTAKQELAALRRLFDWLVCGQVVAANPAVAVRGPKHSATVGKTPILTPAQARHYLGSIPDTSIAGLRDRALIGVMVYTFARISAAVGVDLGDLFREERRLKIRFCEKGGKEHTMPCHHALEAFLLDYMEAAGFGDAAPNTPLFQSIKRGTRELSGRRLYRTEAWYMVRRRALAAGIETDVCNHTFRGTGITAYLQHPDARLEEAQKMANHSDPKTTRLYDRRNRAVSQTEVERISI